MSMPPTVRAVGVSAARATTTPSSTPRLAAGGTTLTGGTALTSILGAATRRRGEVGRGVRWAFVAIEELVAVLLRTFAALAARGG